MANVVCFKSIIMIKHRKNKPLNKGNNMEIKEIDNKKVWEDFFLECDEKTFLQSWNWGEFQEKMGNKIWRFGIFNNNVELLSVTLAVKIIAKRGTFLMVQHGPVQILPKAKFVAGKPIINDNLKVKILKVLLKKLKEIAKKEGCSFIRMAPLLIKNEENKKLFQNLGFREAPMHANAYEASWKLDLRRSEQELLMNMRKATRYLIRQALRNPDIEITKSIQTKDVQLYDKLNQETAKRQQFVPFSFEFIKNEFDVFVKDNQVLLFFGKYRGEIIASAFVIFWSGIGYYHYAALSLKYHKIPIAYLLQWEAIKEAKRRGCCFYDFWGYIDFKKEPNHPWAGPSLFKMGFGGYRKEYIKTQDFPLSKKYWLTFVFEKLRKFKRRL